MKTKLAKRLAESRSVTNRVSKTGHNATYFCGGCKGNRAFIKRQRELANIESIQSRLGNGSGA